MAQTVYAVGTIAATNVVTTPSSVLPHTVIDETSVSDADYFEFETSGATATFLMGEPASAPASGNFTVRVRGNMSAGLGNATLTIQAYDGSTLMGTGVATITDTLTTHSVTFTTAMAHWHSFRLKLTATGITGGDTMAITWMPVDLADAASSIACGGPAAHLMTNTCNVVRGTETQSSTSGGLVTAWATVYTAVCCAIQGSSSREAMQQARETGVAAYDVLFPPGADIRHGDRLTNFAGSAGLSASSRLAVVGNPIDEGGRSAYVFVPAVYETGEVVS